MMYGRDYEQEYCPYCEEWLPIWDTMYTDKDLDYPRGTHLCIEHYKDMFPHDECVVCLSTHEIDEMSAMGYWDGEPLYFCPSCAEAYPCLVKPEDKSATVQEFSALGGSQ